MKILFIPTLTDDSSSGYQRLWALQQQQGVRVYVINVAQYMRFKRIGFVAKVFQEPSLTTKLNQLEHDILNLCEEVKPDIIWFEWPREYNVEFIKTLKNFLRSTLFVCFQDDNPWGDRKKDLWIWKNYLSFVQYFDLHLVKRYTDIENLKLNGAKGFKFWHHGIYSPLFYPSKEHTSYQYPVTFIGTCMDNRSHFIQFLLEAGLPIHVFGNGWTKHAFKLVKRFPSNFHPAVVGKSYGDTIRGSLVSLIMVSASNHDEWTMRSYEVPGCGIAPLAYDTSTHRQMFSEGVTGFFFKDAQSCLSTITGLIDNPNLCKQVGVAVEQDFQHRNWRIEARMEELLKQL